MTQTGVSQNGGRPFGCTNLKSTERTAKFVGSSENSHTHTDNRHFLCLLKTRYTHKNTHKHAPPMASVFVGPAAGARLRSLQATARVCAAGGSRARSLERRGGVFLADRGRVSLAEVHFEGVPPVVPFSAFLEGGYFY